MDKSFDKFKPLCYENKGRVSTFYVDDQNVVPAIKVCQMILDM